MVERVIQAQGKIRQFQEKNQKDEKKSGKSLLNDVHCMYCLVFFVSTTLTMKYILIIYTRRI